MAFVIYCLDHSIKIERNWEKFHYKWDGKNTYYIPDFKYKNNENIFIEIKGYVKDIDREREKLKCFPHQLEYYNPEKMKPYLEYTINKHGNDFIKLYDK